MLTFFHHRWICFDCEWIPNIPAIARFLGVDPNDRDVVRAIRQQQPDYHPETNPRPFLPLPLCRLAAVGIADYNRKTELVRVSHVLADGDTSEREIIAAFLEYIAKAGAQLVGFNSASADLPFLLQRALATGAQIPGFAKRPDKPWEGRDYWADRSGWHVDLRSAVCGFRERGTLQQLCAGLGDVPLKGGIDGSLVWEAWQDPARRPEIGRYAEADAMRVLAIMTRLAYTAGAHDARSITWPGDVLERHPEWG